MEAPATCRTSRLWEEIGRPRVALAPMVDQSELPFRILTRRHGAQLCTTPMFHAVNFLERVHRERHGWAEVSRALPASSRRSGVPILAHHAASPEQTTHMATSQQGSAEGCAADRPLLVQFAANDPTAVLAASRHVSDRCDAVDLNLGCPQRIAKRGHYGAFLLEERELLSELVGTLHCHADVPVTCKIRLLDSLSETIDVARLLQAHGASLLAVHGRTKEQKGAHCGAADWARVKAVADAVSIPVLANGGISSSDDTERCIAATGADGVLVGEAALENPAIFEGGRVGDAQGALAEEYLGIAGQQPTPLMGVKQHLFQMLYAGLQVTPIAEKIAEKAAGDAVSNAATRTGARK